jgi:hypothetical protein
LSFQPKSALGFSRRVILDTGEFKKIQDIVVENDAEISRLQQVRALLPDSRILDDFPGVILRTTCNGQKG